MTSPGHRTPPVTGPPAPVGPDMLFVNSRSSVDDGLAYLGNIHLAIGDCRTVADVGCGRGWVAELIPERNPFDLRGPGRRVIGLDIDPAAAANPLIDEFRLIDPTGPWPLEAGSIDLVVADWTLEHVDDPAAFVAELVRCLRPGGAFIARSISKWSLLSILARAVPNRLHRSVLRRSQPSRDAVDVFPTRYRMNTAKALQNYLGPYFTFTLVHRPGLENYVKQRAPRLARLVAAIERVLPSSVHTAFVVSARRNGG